MARPTARCFTWRTIVAGKTYAYDIHPDGELTNKRLFCNLGSDGMTIDSEGNVYLTGDGVTVFDKTGKQIERIDVPETDDKRDLWRQRPRPALHHREQECLRPQDEGEGGAPVAPQSRYGDWDC